MKRRQTYRVFLTHNFDPTQGFVREAADRAGTRHHCEVIDAAGGKGARGPAELVLERLMTAEGLLVILRRETSWTSSEIGMGFALRMPIFVIADPGVEVGGITKLVTSILSAQTSDPMGLKNALDQAFAALEEAIEAARKKLPEPPEKDRPAEFVSWNRYYEFVRQAHQEVISKDPDPLQKGYKPTLILGISRGGIIAADILSRMSRDLPLGLIEADRITQAATVSYADEPIRSLLREHLADLGPRQARVLIVDDVLKSGRTLEAAVRKVRVLLKELTAQGKGMQPVVQTLVLIVCGEPKRGLVNYPIHRVPIDTNVLLPYGLG